MQGGVGSDFVGFKCLVFRQEEEERSERWARSGGSQASPPLHHGEVGIGEGLAHEGEGFGAAEVVIAGVGRAACRLGGFLRADEFGADARMAAVDFMDGFVRG